MPAASSGCERSLFYHVFSPPVCLFLVLFARLGHAEAELSVSVTQSRCCRYRGLVALGLREKWKQVKITFLLLFWQLPLILAPCFHVDRPHLQELVSFPFRESPHRSDCCGLTLAGCQAPTKATHSLSSAAGQREENLTKGS